MAGLAGLALAGALLVGAAPETAGARERSLSPKAHARIELGRRLFFDPEVSQAGQHSCASCHAPDHGFSDPDRGSTDSTGITPRHSQTILDAAYNPSAHWDGEFASVEELVTERLGSVVVYYGAGFNPRRPRPPVTPRGSIVDAKSGGIPLQSSHHMARRRMLPHKFPPAQGRPSIVADRLNRTERYKEAFRSAFGNPEVTLERLALALSAYCYSVESTEAPYDRYKAGDKEALSPSARRGLLLFEGRAGCFECHKSEGRHALFTDYAFHNTGVAWSKMKDSPEDKETFEGLRRKIMRENAKGDITQSPELIALMDTGRMRFSNKGSDARSFKTPTLRDVALRSPYMHDGRLKTLDEVVRYYSDGCGEDPCKSAHVRPFRASDQDVRDLVAFLEALTGEKRPGQATRAWSARAKKTELAFFDTDEQPISGMKVRLIPVGDSQPTKKRVMADAVLELETDKRGAITYRPGSRTHMRIVLPDGKCLKEGALVPDTCRKAALTVPRVATMTFIFTFPKDVTPPPLLVAEHIAPSTSASRRGGTLAATAGLGPLRTVFKRTEVGEAKDARVAKYVGRVREELPTRVKLRMPGLKQGQGEMHLPDPAIVLAAGAVRRVDLTGE